MTLCNIALIALIGCGGIQKKDIALETAFAGALVLDYKQTQQITDQCFEWNPIIGQCGQRVPPTIYFLLGTLIHAGVTAVIPNGSWRTLFQGLTLGIEAETIHTNRLEGVTIEW
jgi:hypothetical protein